MADIVRDAIAAELELVQRVLPAPTGSLGWGSDLACAGDLTDDMVERDGFDPLVLAEALVRRLDCPRGGLVDDPDYGLDLRSYLNRPTTTREVRALEGQIRNELAKDDRVVTVAPVVTPSPTGEQLAIAIRVTPADPSIGGPFTMILAVTSAEVLLEEIR